MKKIELNDYNLITYKKTLELFKEHDRVAVIQATGTGKSYIAGRYIEDNLGKNIYYFSPSNHINNQFKNDFYCIANDVEFYTYSKMLYFNEEDISHLKPDIIILDEFHRLGGNKWNCAINKILTKYPNVKVLGLSATPTRFLDNNRDMSVELFNGVVANFMTLGDAIKLDIVKKPRYIKGIYDIKTDSDSIKTKIKNSYNENKEELNLKASTIIKNFNKAHGVEDILKKYINNERKILVFCENINHLENSKKSIYKWFSNSFKDTPINIYDVHSDKFDNDVVLNKFKNGDDDEFHILISVSMLNEGLHLPCHCAIFLRNTVSPIIFFQQCGRVITANSDRSPLIFDFVNNCSSILEYRNKGESCDAIDRNDKEIVEMLNEFHVYDETGDISQLLNEIEDVLFTVWDVRFEELIAFVNEYGHFHIPKSMYSLNRWCNKQRTLRNILSKRKFALLDEIGFPWNAIDYEWERNFQSLVDFFSENNTLLVPHIEKNKKLYTWIKTQRDVYRNGKMSEYRKEKLTSIGFIFDNEANAKNKWMDMYSRLLEFKKEYGHPNVSSKYHDKKLAQWVGYQRRKAHLFDWKVQLLNEIGFDWKGRM